MDKEVQLFLEDAHEQFEYMEDALMSMQEQGINAEKIDAVFRAMHTIKGSAGMFGYDAIVAFTHIVESLLSEVRSQRAIITDAMIHLLLECKDHTQTLIDVALNNTTLVHKITAFMPENSLATLNMKSTSLNKEALKIDEGSLWKINILLHEDFFSSGMDILALIACLDNLGKIEEITPLIDQIPLLIHYNPIASYIGFDILLSTESSLEAIEEIFEFVLDDIDLKILKSTSQERRVNKIEDIKNVSLHKNTTLKVDSYKVDYLINKVSEMIITNATIIEQTEKFDDIAIDESTTTMSELLEEVRSSVLNIRMVQVGDSFNRYRRVISETSQKLGKNIKFIIDGGETELDKRVIEKISDPIMHMLRNALDHGVELPHERVLQGKNEQATVKLSVFPDAGRIVITINDDGRGLDKEKIFAKALEKGLVDKDKKYSDKDIYGLIFLAGLSTAEELSDLSGRGVGMDVVKKNIQELHGTIEIDSTLNVGSTFTIKLPLTLAIIDGFLVQSGATKYIIPLEMIQECVELSQSYKKQMRGNQFINLRDSILPLLDMRVFFKEEANRINRENIVVVSYGEERIGLQVDELFGEFQTVIKPLGEIFQNVSGISGATLLGSGEVALILDIPKLIEFKIHERV